MVRKFLMLGVGALLVSGCALPLPLQIASWALDGVSVLATQKSVTDHGISLVTQKDCAVWRGVMKGELCRDDAISDVLVADDVVKTSSASALVNGTSLNTNTVSLSVGPVETNADTSPSSQALIQVIPAPKISTPVEPKPTEVASIMAPDQITAAKVSQQIGAEPTKGIYFVIGSSRDPEYAQRLLHGNEKFLPIVLMARLGGVKVYRVVVGPVQQGDEKQLLRTLTLNGFSDTWAIRIKPSDWRVANLPKSAPKTSSEIANLQK